MKKAIMFPVMAIALSLLALVACNKTEENSVVPSTNATSTVDDPTDNNPTISGGVPDVYKKIYGATNISIDGDYVVITCNGLPDHKSPYYQGTQWDAAMYEAYNGSNSAFHLNPNRISQANLVFRIPLNPTEASAKRSTPMGPMGVSLNGVPFYNQYAAGGAPLTGEINSFDQYNGHPQQMGGYHYHIEPLFLTANHGKEGLMGFLLDGFPVYGPEENGQTVVSSSLDAYHGHSHATADYPDGIYHYHLSADAPYLNGDGFFGNAGTVAQ
ncbi:MAG: YHYH protein [Flavipsychrobacter sp.]